MNNPNCPVCNNPTVKNYFMLKSNGLTALKCKNCNHVFIKNSPITSSNASNFYTMEDFKGNRKTQPVDWYTNYYRDCFADYNSYLNSSLTLKQFQEKTGYFNSHFPQKGRFLDIGCATGVFLDMMRNNGWKVEGVEISNELASYAKEKFSLKVHVIDLTRDKLNTKPFHVITLFDVIEHIPDPNLMIVACKELLHKNGLLLIRTPTEEGLLRGIGKILYRASLNKFELPMLWFYSYEHIHSFSLKSLKMILEKYNFQIVKVFREEESIDRLNIPSFVKILLSGINYLSFVLNKQHKITVIAKKN